MGTVRGFLNSTKRARASLDSDVQTAIKLVEDQLIDLNTEEQLFKGIGTDGKIIGRYSRATEEITRGMSGIGFPKKAGEPFNFYDTGAVFKGMAYRFKNGDRLELFTTDSKMSELEEKYGNKLFGLTIENTQEFNYKILLPVLRGFIKRHYRS
jgi:hypothetical protein